MRDADVSNDIRFCCPRCGQDILRCIQPVMQRSQVDAIIMNDAHNLNIKLSSDVEYLKSPFCYYRCAICDFPDHEDKDHFQWKCISDVQGAGVLVSSGSEQVYELRAQLIDELGNAQAVIIRSAHQCRLTLTERTVIIERAKIQFKELNKKSLFLICETDSAFNNFKASAWTHASIIL